MEINFLERPSSGETVELRFHRVRLGAVCAAWFFVFFCPIALFLGSLDFSAIWIALALSVLFGAGTAFDKGGGFVSSYDESGLYCEVYGFRIKYAYEDITKVSKWSFLPIWIIRAKKWRMVILPVGWLLKGDSALAGLEERLRRAGEVSSGT